MAQVVVNKSDTFEVQRQKINEIGLDLHTFSGNQINLNATYITLTDLNVTVNSAGGAGNLTYDNTTGAIVYTPPDLSNFITSIGDAIQDADFTSAGLMVTDGAGNYSVVTDNSATWVTLQGLQVTNNTPSAGGASLSYNNTTGVFGYTPQDVSDFIALTDISVTQNVVGTAALSYNDATGVLTYTPPDLSGYLTGLPSHSHSLISLSDTSLIGADAPLDGEVLTYDASNTVWKAVAPGGNIPDLQDVCDEDSVTTTDITAGNLIVSDAGQFSIGTSQYATLGYNAAGSKVIYNGNNSDLDIVADQLDYYSGATLKATLSTTGLNVAGSVTGTSFVKTGGTATEFLKADGTVDTSTYLTGIDIEDISNVNITAIQTNQILKWDGTEWVNALDSGGAGGGIALGDLTVGTEGSPSGNGGLSYNNLTGQFTFTPAADNTIAFNHANATTSQIIYTNNGAGTPYTLNLIAGTGITFGQGGGTGALTITGTSGIALTDLSIGTEGSASGDGAIAYNNTTGEFSYTPPDLSGYLTGYTETDTLDDVCGRGTSTDKNITLTGTSSFPGRFDVQNNGNYAISLNATAGVGINTADGVGLNIANLATNVWRASIDGSTGDITSAGDITGDAIIKSGGTSSQFLKADGSVDSSTYLTSVSLASSNISDLADVNAGSPSDGHVLKWDNGTSKWISAPDGGGSGSTNSADMQHDMWVLTTKPDNDTTMSYSGAVIGDGSSRNGDLGRPSTTFYNKNGTGMSESNGVFTFPSDGQWEVNASVIVAQRDNTGGGVMSTVAMQHSENQGASWTTVVERVDETITNQSASWRDWNLSFIFNVDNYADERVRFIVTSNSVTTLDDNNGGNRYSQFFFKKLDTGSIALSDLSVTTNAAGTAALSYNTGTGVFSYTPPDLSAVSTDLTAFSVGANASASGGGGLAYNNTSGAFTYTPPDLSSYITGLSVNELSDVTISSPQNGHVLKYNGTSWENGPDETGSGNADNIAENNTKVETIDTGGGTGKITFDIEGTEAVQIDANRQILIAGTQSGNNVAKIFNDTDGAGTGVLGIYASSNNANPRDVRIYSGGGTANEIFRAGKSGQLGVAGDVGSSGQVLTSGGPNAAATWENQVTPGIQLTALSVTQNSAGTAGLSYNNVSGVFTYTPPNVSSFISLGSLSVGSPQTASGDGAISYNSTNGVFSYTPPDLSAHLTTSSVIANLQDVVISGSPQSGQVLKWDNGTSKWTNQADASGGSTLTTEQVQDIVGAMFTGNTETRIAATYQDGDGTIDLVVDDMTANTPALTTEQVQDIVGSMFSGNTETRISATYQDADGTIDLVVDDMSGGGGGDVEIIADLTDVVISGSPADNQVLAWDNATSKWTNQTPSTGSTFPAGGIIMWSGSVANIPSGWVLCNGSNSTPDLRNKFVIGAGSSYNPGASGGATSVTLSTSNMPSHSHTGASHSHTIGSHSHTVSSHSHTIGSHTHTFSSLVNGYTSIQSDNHYHTANTSSGGSHSHTYSRLNSQTSYTRGIPIGSGGAAGSSFGTQTTDAGGAHTHYVETGGVSDNHDHTLNATVNGTTGASSGSTSSENPGTSSNGSGSTGSGGSGSTGSTGSGSAVSTMPPYYALCYIMKT